jgi:hypothetical protein
MTEPQATSRRQKKQPSFGQRVAMLLIYGFTLLPFTVATAIFTLHGPSRAMGIDTLLSLGLGSRAPGVAWVRGCEP